MKVQLVFFCLVLCSLIVVDGAVIDLTEETFLPSIYNNEKWFIFL